MASLINGDQMRERLEKLLKKTDRTNGDGNLKEKKGIKLDGKFSYARSFEGGD